MTTLDAALDLRGGATDTSPPWGQRGFAGWGGTTPGVGDTCCSDVSGGASPGPGSEPPRAGDGVPDERGSRRAQAWGPGSLGDPPAFGTPCNSRVVCFSHRIARQPTRHLLTRLRTEKRKPRCCGGHCYVPGWKMFQEERRFPDFREDPLLQAHCNE